MKFRRWNEDTKEFCYFDNGRYYYQDCVEEIKSDYYRSTFIMRFWQNAEIGCQINNLFVYAGDLIERNGEIGVCVFKDGQMWIKIKDGLTIGSEYSLHNFNQYTYENNGHESYNTHNTYKLVGNIHENKETFDEFK